jgi:hypothetical protein
MASNGKDQKHVMAFAKTASTFSAEESDELDPNLYWYLGIF